MCTTHAAALLPKEAALVRSFAARLQQNLGFLEHGPHTAIGARLRDGGARPRHGPEVAGSAAAGAGHGEEERVAQCGLYIYTLCPASSALWTSCCRGARTARTARTLSTASTPALPSPAGHGHADRGPDHAELVAGLCGLHVAAGVILRLAASAQLLALVKKVNLILARRAALRRMK